MLHCPEKKEAFSEKSMPDLTGYVAIVTGGNSGVGYETTKQLALRNARVYIAGRSEERISEAIAKMKEETQMPSLNVSYLLMDLQDLKSVRSAALRFMELEPRLDILINNAGVMTVPFKLTGDGYETQWQVNFLALFVFTVTLLPLLLSTAAGSGREDRVRVVNVSSDAASGGPDRINYEDVNLTNTKGVMELWTRYGHSKQAVIRFTKELNDRYRYKGVTAYSVHPGIIKTNLQSHDPSIIGKTVRVVINYTASTTPLQGSLNSLYCATSSEALWNQGKFMLPVGKLEPKADKWLNDLEGNAKLWRLGEEQMSAAVSE